MAEETDPYLEVARRFFNEFLELKVRLDHDPQEDRRTRVREIERHAEERTKLTQKIQYLADENRKLSDSLAASEEKLANARRQLNEMILKYGKWEEKLATYPLEEHMSERAFREWRKIMQELPRAKGN